MQCPNLFSLGTPRPFSRQTSVMHGDNSRGVPNDFFYHNAPRLLSPEGGQICRILIGLSGHRKHVAENIKTRVFVYKQHVKDGKV